MQKHTLLIILLCIIGLSSCTAQKSGKKDKAQQETNTTTKPEKMTQVLIKTTLGNIKVELYNETPQHRDNFIKLVNEQYYDGVLFHRIIKGFMVQTGDPDSKTAKPGQRLGMGGPAYRIPAEIVPELFHRRGALAAARDNNPQKASSGSQFYIVDGTVYSEGQLEAIAMRSGKTFTEEQKKIYSTEGGAPWLDGDYTVFGCVIDGMDVIDKIAAQEKDQTDRPVNDIKIIKATIIK